MSYPQSSEEYQAMMNAEGEAEAERLSAEQNHIDNRKEICDKIAEDAKNDAINFDGKPFNGRTVAEYFGNHGAAIAALADILKSVLEDFEKLNKVVTVQESDTTEADSSNADDKQK